MLAGPGEVMHYENRVHNRLTHGLAVLLCFTLLVPAVAAAQPSSADKRARDTEQRMTNEERLSLVVGLAPTFAGAQEKRVPSNVPVSAGYVGAVPRLGIPALRRRPTMSESVGSRRGSSPEGPIPA
jgi:hypothetical protein